MRRMNISVVIFVFVGAPCVVRDASRALREDHLAALEYKRPDVEFLHKIRPEAPAKLSFMKLRFLSEGSLLAIDPHKPVLFCVTEDDRLLIIHTASRAITREIDLADEVLDKQYTEVNPVAVSPQGKLLAIANQNGMINMLKLSE